jgi:hypothetical protein
VSRVLPDGDLETAAREFAERLAAGPTGKASFDGR